MTSSTGTSPPSLICMAASIACVSKGLRFFSPLRSIRPVEASMRFSTAASGTSLTRTQIFNSGASSETGKCVFAMGSAADDTALTDQPIALAYASARRVRRAGREALRRGADCAAHERDDVLRGRAGCKDLGDAELLQLGDVVGRDRAADRDDHVVDVLR